MARDASKNNKITGMIRHHLETARAALLGTPWWAWLLPLVLSIGILLLRETPIGWFTEKPSQELVAPVVIGLAAGIAFFVHLWLRQFFTLLLVIFAWALFFRELHFYGTDNGLYATIVILAWLASTRRDELHDFLRWPSIRGLLSAAVWTYFITKMFDRHYFSFLPNYYSWNNNVEETLETLAHVIVLALVVVTLRIGSLQGGDGAGSERASPGPDAD